MSEELISPAIPASLELEEEKEHLPYLGLTPLPSPFGVCSKCLEVRLVSVATEERAPVVVWAVRVATESSPRAQEASLVRTEISSLEQKLNAQGLKQRSAWVSFRVGYFSGWVGESVLWGGLKGNAQDFTKKAEPRSLLEVVVLPSSKTSQRAKGNTTRSQREAITSPFSLLACQTYPPPKVATDEANEKIGDFQAPASFSFVSGWFSENDTFEHMISVSSILFGILRVHVLKLGYRNAKHLLTLIAPDGIRQFLNFLFFPNS